MPGLLIRCPIGRHRIPTGLMLCGDRRPARTTLARIVSASGAAAAAPAPLTRAPAACVAPPRGPGCGAHCQPDDANHARPGAPWTPPPSPPRRLGGHPAGIAPLVACWVRPIPPRSPPGRDSLPARPAGALPSLAGILRALGRSPGPAHTAPSSLPARRLAPRCFRGRLAQPRAAAVAYNGPGRRPSTGSRFGLDGRRHDRRGADAAGAGKPGAV